MFSTYNYNDSDPDYSQPLNWAALPGKSNNSANVPHSSISPINKPKADVFYIHPTTYMAGVSWNASLQDINVNEAVDIGPIRHQASVFNGSCAIYAPRYRQAVLKTFFSDSEDGQNALHLAYSDVKSAFEYYIKNFNNGRPFIIAAHSQGTMHAVKLIKEFVDNDILKKQFIASYLPGMPMKRNEFKTIPECSKPAETGCFASWNTYQKGTHGYDYFYKESVCTNPLTWSSDQRAIGSENHLGSVPVSFDRIDKNIIAAQIIENKLEIEPISVQGYNLLNQAGNYHLGDYNLFYMNIRENVKLQVENF